MIFLIFITVMLTARLKLKTLAAIMGMALISASPIWRYGLHEYQRKRVEALLNPDSAEAWQSRQALNAIGSGRFLGKGFLQATQIRIRRLPALWTDFPFAVWAEEWGFVGCLIVLAGYLILILWTLKIASEARDRFGATVCVGVAAMLFWHVAVNVGMVIGVLPVVGVTLPLISHTVRFQRADDHGSAGVGDERVHPSLQRTDMPRNSVSEAEPSSEVRVTRAASRVRDPLLGRIVGAYRIQERVGEGTGLPRYLAEHVHLDRRVLFKLFHPAARRRRIRGGEAGQIQQARELSALKHEGVPLPLVEIAECGDGFMYVVLELSGAQVLPAVLAERGPLSWPVARTLGRQVARAMLAAGAASLASAEPAASQIFLAKSPAGELRALVDLVTPEAFGCQRRPPFRPIRYARWDTCCTRCWRGTSPPAPRSRRCRIWC